MKTLLQSGFHHPYHAPRVQSLIAFFKMTFCFINLPSAISPQHISAVLPFLLAYIILVILLVGFVEWESLTI